MYDCVPHACLVPGQEKGLDPWELELQKVVGHQVGAKNPGPVKE